MTTTDLELTYETPDGSYDPFNISISWMDGRLDDGPRWVVNDWDFQDDTDRSTYNNIIADGVDKTTLDTWIESQISDAEPPE